MTMMTSNPLEQVREVLRRGMSLSWQEHRRDVLAQAEVFKAAFAKLEAVHEQAKLEGRGYALRHVADLTAELSRPLRWIAEAEGKKPPVIPTGYCNVSG